MINDSFLWMYSRSFATLWMTGGALWMTGLALWMTGGALWMTGGALDDIWGGLLPPCLGGQVFTAFFFTTGGFVLGGVAGLHLAEGEVGKDTHQG